ncbi:hypothetical protein BOX15_Mlig007128g1, partial [Macrostomum lignano]
SAAATAFSVPGTSSSAGNNAQPPASDALSPTLLYSAAHGCRSHLNQCHGLGESCIQWWQCCSSFCEWEGRSGYGTPFKVCVRPRY